MTLPCFTSYYFSKQFFFPEADEVQTEVEQEDEDAEENYSVDVRFTLFFEKFVHLFSFIAAVCCYFTISRNERRSFT